MKSILVVPDVHCSPVYDNKRMSVAGEYAAVMQPDTIVFIGDVADMPSLNSHESITTLATSNHTYRADIESVHDGVDRFMHQLRRRKRKLPRIIITLGNHEARINTTLRDNPTFSGWMSMDDLGYEDYGWETVPFKDSIVVDGIHFSHYFASGLMGRPIGGEHTGATLCKKLHCSAVQGHSHIFDHAERTRPDGTKIFGMTVGCFTHPNAREGWNANSFHLWWRGLVYLGDVDGKGYYDDMRCITLRKLMREYGSMA